jgi:hypothetical protein
MLAQWQPGPLHTQVNTTSVCTSNSQAAAERTPSVMGKISSCDPSIEWCKVKDGGGNANVATVAAKIALMSTMAAVLSRCSRSINTQLILGSD